jgi:Mg-chelatase subunit ChlD
VPVTPRWQDEHRAWRRARPRLRPRPWLRRHGERGAVTVTAVLCALALATAALGSAAVGRIVAERQDAQRAVDAATAAALAQVASQGLPFDAAKRSHAEVVARGNLRSPVVFQWAVSDTPAEVTISCTARLGVAMPRLVFPDGGASVTATASGRVAQQKIGDAQRRVPKLVLVLDYSGSMSSPMRLDPNHTSISMLKRAVKTLLGLGYAIQYGAVLFSTGILGEVPVALGDEDAVRSTVEDHGLDDLTATWMGLARARELLEASPGDDKRFVLLVSDGRPQDPDAAKREATKLWDDGTTIYTLHVDNSTPDEVQPLHDFMVGVSGSPSSRHDETYYRRAAAGDTLQAIFATIGSEVGCIVGPLDPAPPDGSRLHVLLAPDATSDATAGAAGAAETPLRDAHLDGAHSQRDLTTSGFASRSDYWYQPAERTLFVTPSVCDRIDHQHQTVVVRYGRPSLTR